MTPRMWPIGVLAVLFLIGGGFGNFLKPAAQAPDGHLAVRAADGTGGEGARLRVRIYRPGSSYSEVKDAALQDGAVRFTLPAYRGYQVDAVLYEPNGGNGKALAAGRIEQAAVHPGETAEFELAMRPMSEMVRFEALKVGGDVQVAAEYSGPDLGFAACTAGLAWSVPQAESALGGADFSCARRAAGGLRTTALLAVPEAQVDVAVYQWAIAFSPALWSAGDDRVLWTYVSTGDELDD